MNYFAQLVFPDLYGIHREEEGQKREMEMEMEAEMDREMEAEMDREKKKTKRRRNEEDEGFEKEVRKRGDKKKRYLDSRV